MSTRNEQLFERAQRSIPGGVNSPVRAFRSVGGTPRFFTRGAGSRLWDATAEDLRDRLGVLRALPDDLLLRVIALAGAQALSRCACSSRCLRVLAYTEELWKTCLLTELEGNKSKWLQWDTRGWRHSYLRHRGATLALAPPAAEDASATEERAERFVQAFGSSWPVYKGGPDHLGVPGRCAPSARTRIAHAPPVSPRCMPSPRRPLTPHVPDDAACALTGHCH